MAVWKPMGNAGWQGQPLGSMYDDGSGAELQMEQLRNNNALDLLKKQQQGMAALRQPQQQQQGRRIVRTGYRPATAYGAAVKPIWSESQIQQRVNSAQGVNNQATANNVRQMEGQMAGRGFGSNSPLQMALAAQMGAAARSANVDADLDTRWNASQGNEQHMQQARLANAAGKNAVSMANAGNRNAYNMSLMNAMSRG